MPYVLNARAKAAQTAPAVARATTVAITPNRVGKIAAGCCGSARKIRFL
jgi:hypothetical protein